MILLRLFYEFFRTGLFLFGGGLAAIPFLQEISYRTGWFTMEQLMDMIAVSEAAPGPIGINMATYVGYTVAGIPGGVVASLGLIAPSLFIVTVVARVLDKFRDSSLVNSALYGLRPASLGLVAAAGITVLRLSLLPAGPLGDAFLNVNLWGILLAAVMFVLINRVKAHPIVFLAGSAGVGVLLGF